MNDEAPKFPLPVVRDEPPRPRQRRRVRALMLHIVRLCIFVAVLALIRIQHKEFLSADSTKEKARIDIGVVIELFPSASDVTQSTKDSRVQTVRDASGNRLGYIVQTSPLSDDVVGFSGPTNVLIAFGTDDRVLGARILWSRDTREHANLIHSDEHFLNSWNGLTWEQAAEPATIDGVSGATLTAIAIQESVVTRFGGKKPNLRFPQAPEVDEVSQWLDGAADIVASESRIGMYDVRDATGTIIGGAIRTTPAADAIVGYQGPTDSLLVVNRNDRIVGMVVRSSFDNEPYVGYVREDDYFLNIFNDRSPTELASLDLEEAEVEGVSGATMTSMAVAEAAVRAAIQSSKPPAVPTRKREPGFTLRRRDIGTAGVLILGLTLGLTRLRRIRFARFGYQILVIGYLGFTNGDLVSQAILVGWSQNGIPWRLATGLLLVTATALLTPAVSRSQVYCHQICPHGAAQQLVMSKLPWQWSPRGRIRRSLLAIPYVLLFVILTIAMLHLPVSPVDLEPFDAYVVRAAGPAALSIAVIGFILSFFVPMAYCRYGCPTGAVLDFLRFNSASDYWSRTDGLAVALLITAAVLSVMT